MSYWYRRCFMVVLGFGIGGFALSMTPDVVYAQNPAFAEAIIRLLKKVTEGAPPTSLSMSVSVSWDSLSLKAVLLDLETQSAIEFLYNSQELPLDRRITFSAEAIPLDSALKVALAGTNMVANMMDRDHLLIEKKPPAKPGAASDSGAKTRKSPDAKPEVKQQSTSTGRGRS